MTLIGATFRKGLPKQEQLIISSLNVGIIPLKYIFERFISHFKILHVSKVTYEAKAQNL